MTPRTTTSFSLRRGRERFPFCPTHDTSRPPLVKVLLPDLPPEILFIVFECLPDEDLYCLAFCCRYLHHIALPAYLSRYGLSPNSGEFIFDNIMADDALKALNSALFRPRLHRLVYTYDLGHMAVTSCSPSKTASIAADNDPSFSLYRLLELVDVEEVHLQLGDLGVKTRAEDHLAEPGPYEAEARQDRLMLAIERLGKDWVGMLNELLFKARCRHLTFELVTHQRPTSLETIEGAIIDNYYGFNSIFAAGRKLSWRAVEGSSRWLGVRTPKLEKFQVHSEALFHPLLINWTIRTLGLSTLTCVAFDQLHHFTPQTWSLLLPCITIPNLLHLSISLCAIQTADLVPFLLRHPKIQELHLGANLRTPPLNLTISPKRGQWSSLTGDGTQRQIAFLPSLRVLAAPPDYLVAFLSSPIHPLSTLETVRVWYRARRASQFTLNALNHDLAPVCVRLRSVKEVVLSVSFETSGLDWVVGSEGGGGGQGNYQQKQHRGISSGSASAERGGMHNGSAGGLADMAFPPSVSFVSSCVTRLEFNTNVYVLPTSIIYFLPKWFRPFLKMRELSMRTLASGRLGAGTNQQGHAGGAAGGSAGMTRDQAFELQSHKDVFLHGVSRHCPSVRKIEVDGREEEAPIVRRIARLL